MNKILIINNNNIKYSGSKIRNLNLAIEFSKRNKKVFLVEENRLEVFERGKRVINKKINLFNFFILFLKKYEYWMCDVIKYAIIFKKNLIFTLHDNKEWTNYNRKGLLKKILLYIVVKKSKYCFTLSKKLSNFFSNKYNKKFHITRNGLAPAWKKKPTKKMIKGKYMIYVSNFAIHKNHLSLINFQKNLNFKIILVGKYNNEQEAVIYHKLKENKNFKIISNLNDLKLQSLVKYSDLVLFPSKLEGFGIPIIEALSQGKSVLIENSLKKQLPLYFKCKKLFFHDFSKKINSIKVKNIIKKKTCKNCIYKNFDWSQIVKDIEYKLQKK